MAGNEGRFIGRAEGYARFRQGYPAEVAEVLRARCGLGPGYRVADVGAGTGMVAELLLQAGCSVTAVEPNAEMRAVCEALLGGRAETVDGTAEVTGLRAASYDMVTAGRAFHWFDRARAVPEFERILKPAGWVVLLSNRRAGTGSEQALAYRALLIEHGEAAHERRLDEWDEVLERYRRGGCFRLKLPGMQRMTLEQLVGQTESLSTMPLPGAPGSAELRAALSGFFARYSQAGLLGLETECEIAGWQVS